MHLAHLRLRDFRNYASLDLDLAPGFHLFLGDNAQGKTNILEAIYLLSTLRSFRGVGGAQMIRHDARGYFVGAEAVGEGRHEIRMFWSRTQRRLTVDGEPVRTLSQYWGLVRAVVFCTEDLQLVKGPPARRRRYLDLLLAQTHPSYLGVLQRYTRALRSRNALLKRRPIDPAALEGFTRELVTLGNQLMAARRDLMPKVSPLARLAYRRISDNQEELKLDYQPSVRADFALELAQARRRELELRATVLGPHRDDVELAVNDRPAAQFASEGQKRSLAVALKMAQAEYLAGIHGTSPVLLIDDVMGELDARRRGALLPLLERARQARTQVFMTATEERWPAELAERSERWWVRAGTVSRRK